MQFDAVHWSCVLLPHAEKPTWEATWPPSALALPRATGHVRWSFGRSFKTKAGRFGFLIRGEGY